MTLQVQHCIIGDGLEATLLALSLARLKQKVALVQTAQPVLESYAVAVTELNPNLAALHQTAHQQWPQLPGFKPAQWRVQGMAAHQPAGGVIHTVAALGAFIREFRGQGGDYIQVNTPQDITLTVFEGKITGVNAADRINAEKVVLANGIEAHNLARDINIYLPLQPQTCYGVGFSYTEQVTVPPIAIKLPQGHVYIFSDGPQHVQVLFTSHAASEADAVMLVERLIHALLPKITWQPHDRVHTWHNAASSDGLPLVGPVEGVEGLWVCSGLKEQAALLAPALAANLAESLCDRPTSPVMNDLMPARIQRVAVTQRAGGEVIKGEEHLVQPDGTNIQRGEEHLIAGPQLTKGEKHLVAAPELIKGEEHFVDGAGNPVRSTAAITTQGEAKVQIASLKNSTSSDKKVTMGSLKKDGK